jgi:hypothetical protein
MGRCRRRPREGKKADANLFFSLGRAVVLEVAAQKRPEEEKPSVPGCPREFWTGRMRALFA